LPKEPATTTHNNNNKNDNKNDDDDNGRRGKTKKKNTETLKHKIENNREHTNCQWIKKIRKSTKHSYYTDR
jgi:DNA-binding transcriptional regulator YiaG